MAQIQLFSVDPNSGLTPRRNRVVQEHEVSKRLLTKYRGKYYGFLRASSGSELNFRRLAAREVLCVERAEQGLPRHRRWRHVCRLQIAEFLLEIGEQRFRRRLRRHSVGTLIEPELNLGKATRSEDERDVHRPIGELEVRAFEPAGHSYVLVGIAGGDRAHFFFRHAETVVRDVPGSRRRGLRGKLQKDEKSRSHFSHLASHPSTSPYQCFEFWPFRIQWFSWGQ